MAVGDPRLGLAVSQSLGLSMVGVGGAALAMADGLMMDLCEVERHIDLELGQS